MHPMAIEVVVASVQRRVAQGDCPTEPPQSRETLEEVICELARARLGRKIAADPDGEPMAGGPAVQVTAYHCEDGLEMVGKSPEQQPGDRNGKA